MKFIPNGSGKFRFWCQKVLPLVYDDSLSYYEVICKLTKFVNELAERIANAFEEINTNVQEYVYQWLDDHPEATTTVQDGAITVPKLNQDVIDYIDGVGEDAQEAMETKLNTSNNCEYGELTYLYTLGRQKAYLQGACTDGTFLYWVDFTSNNDAYLVKTMLSNNEEITRRSIQDYTTDGIHGNGICYCPNDNCIYLININGDFVYRVNASSFNLVNSHKFRPKITEAVNLDPNNAIAWNRQAGIFVSKRSYSNEIELYSYEQVNGGYYNTHASLPYKHIAKYRGDMGALCGTEQNLDFFRNYMLLPQDRHTGRQHSGMTVMGVNGVYIKDIVFANDDIGNELEAIVSDDTAIYVVYADGKVYTLNTTSLAGGSLVNWGGNVDLWTLPRSEVRCATIYDAHETAVASDDSVTSKPTLVSDIPASYDSAINAKSLTFYVETNSWRAIPLTIEAPLQSFEHGLSQVRKAIGIVPYSYDQPTWTIQVMIQFHFERGTDSDADKMNIVIDDSYGKIVQVNASTGVTTYSNLSQFRIDGIVANF